MSGFVGILNLDGAPVDRALLERMTRFLAFRGPDAQEVLCHGTLGLGHAMLRVTREAAAEKQPGSLEDRLYIAGDARIDARAELITKLKSKSGAAGSLSLATPDSELILHAYDCWGEACVEHLLGDFSFAIWDARKRNLFCARDPFGVKPFFYAQVGSLLICSNTLNCIRMHPAVSNRLNDLAIADFLLVDMNHEPATTSFADIQRLPPAHTLVCGDGKVSIRRYWELRVSTPVYFRREEEYVELFRELLDTAVADRIRGDSAGVLMSGGLDSTTVAASARRISTRNGHPSDLRAYTEVFDSLVPHQERHYAALAAKGLDIAIEYLVSDHWRIFERADQPEYRTPEPTHTALPDTTLDQLRQVAAHGRVVLTGYGGDPALCGRLTIHFRTLLKNRQFGQMSADAVRFLGAEGRLSRLYLSTRLRLLFASKEGSSTYPQWLNEDLGRKFNLSDRWRSAFRAGTPNSDSAVRPEAYEVIASYLWPNLFEMHDAGVTRVPVEVYHPIFDLRVLSFLLALPRLPWCTDKELLREAARGDLPDGVRLRRKTAMPASPVVGMLQSPDSAWVDRFDPVPELENYLVRNRIPAVYRERDYPTAWMHLRPLSLNFWLRTVHR
jgi:asparagine synthase (glutamine-hydrolysing)